ncbi:MDR family MFS transporter [Holzapfeliella sp. JNUCC 80]
METTQNHLDIHGKPYNRITVMLLILFATFAGILMQTSLGTALPTLMKEFDINLSTAQQATTWFLLANGVMIPLTAYLATRISTRILHVGAYGLLAIGIGLTALTPANHSAWIIFLIGRVLAAIAVGVMMPLMQIVILNMFNLKERATALGLGGLVIGMGPAIGPTLSGWILDQNHVVLGLTISNSWRTIFVLPLIVVLIAFVLSPFVMKDVIPNKSVKLDVLSLFLSVIGFGLFLLGFTNVATAGWTDFMNVILPIVAGIALLVIFVLRQLKLKVPFLDVRVFKVKDFTIPTLTVIMVAMAMYGVEMMLPTYLQNVHGLTPLNSGLTLLGGALMMGIVSPIAGILYNKVGVKRLALVGLSVVAIGTLPFTFLSATTPTHIITVLYAVRMMGVALTMMPLTTRAMAALPTELSTHATAANNTMRQVSTSIVVALLTSVTQNIMNTHAPAEALKAADPIKYGAQTLTASMDGFRVAFTMGLAFAVIGFIMALFVTNQPQDKKNKTK